MDERDLGRTRGTGHWVSPPADACVAVYAYSYAGQRHWQLLSVPVPVCRCQCLYAALTLPRICSRVSSLAFGRAPGPGQQDSSEIPARIARRLAMGPAAVSVKKGLCASAHLPSHPATQSASLSVRQLLWHLTASARQRCGVLVATSPQGGEGGVLRFGSSKVSTKVEIREVWGKLVCID